MCQLANALSIQVHQKKKASHLYVPPSQSQPFSHLTTNEKDASIAPLPNPNWLIG